MKPAGTRGATSAEYFLQHGYAVIFMHRQYSLQPFSRHYSHSVNPFLDFLEIVPDHNASATTPAADGSTTHTRTASSDVKIEVDEATTPELAKVLKTYKAVKKAGTLHTLTFVTVNDYLFLLRAISHELSKLGPNVIYYLAAAVSDFFLPMTKMVRFLRCESERY
jgi:phosphopantothenate---cysteine ligase (ATP)